MITPSTPRRAGKSGNRTLNRSEEQALTRQIAGLEEELWRAILANPSKAKLVIDCILSAQAFAQCFESEVEIRAAISALLAAAEVQEKSVAHKASRQSGQSYGKCVDHISKLLTGNDFDRNLVREAVNEVMQRGNRHRAGKSELLSAHALGVFEVQQRLARLRDYFIEANQGLVVFLASRYSWARMPMNDLIQEGNLGLIKAVNRFDYTKGYQFNTYASWWIQSDISRAIDNKETIIRVPCSATRNRSRLNKAVRSMQMRTGRTPTDEEIREETGMGKLLFSRAREHAMENYYSLDQTISESNSLRYCDILVDESFASPYEATMVGTMTKEMVMHLASLSQMERTILARRFGLEDDDEMTLQQIADQYGLSRERIRQIQNCALLKLRQWLTLDAA